MKNSTLGPPFNMMLKFAQEVFKTSNCHKIIGFKMRYDSMLCHDVPTTSGAISAGVCEKKSFLHDIFRISHYNKGLK